MKYVFEWLGAVGKGENAGYRHCLLFPQNVQKLPFLGSLTVFQTISTFDDSEDRGFRKLLRKRDIHNFIEIRHELLLSILVI